MLCSAELTEVGGRQLSTWCTLYTVQGLGGCTPTWRQSCNVQYGPSGARFNVQCARRKSAARNWASGEDWALGGVGEHVAEQILRIALATTGSMFPHYINGYAWFFIRFQWG